MRGQLEPGTLIEPDALLQELDVSRTVLREALKVLTSKGLIDARPRLGTHVTERSRWQLLDPDVMRWRATDEPDPRLVTELGEVRQIIEPAAARMAALNRTEAELARIRQAYDELVATAEQSTLAVHADAAFHNAILVASGNELLERFEVILEPALHARDRIAFEHRRDDEFLECHRLVLEAIANQDAEAAYSSMSELTSLAMRDAAESLRVSDEGNRAHS